MPSIVLDDLFVRALARPDVYLTAIRAEVERLTHERNEATAKMQIMQGMMVAAFDQRDAIKLETIERCAEACEGERVEIETETDMAYNEAIVHVAAAIRALIEDPETIWQANPGAGIRIDPEWCRTVERGTMTPESWCVERLGVVFAAESGSGVLPVVNWQACRDTTSTVEGGRIALSVGPGGSWSAIGLAGERDDGSLHVEVVRHAVGTDWLVEAAKAGTADYGPLLVDPKGPTMAVLATLEQAGIEVEELAPGDVTRACAELQLDVKNCRVRHLDQQELNAAVVGVDVRTVGEAWVFSARASTVDVCPLLAVTLAAHGARVAGSVDPMTQIF
jgi:hypothetical protein